jgi:hypothetical protein
MNKKILNFTEKSLVSVSENAYEDTNDNIISVGYGFKKVGNFFTNEKSLVFGVKQKKKISDIDPADVIPEFVSVDGHIIKTDVIESAEIKPMACDPSFYAWQFSTPQNQTKIRPIQGGVSAINYTEMYGSSCTLGFLAKDNYDDTIVGISNVHCAATEPFAPNDTSLYKGVYAANEIIQPSESSDPNDIIAFLKRIIFLKRDSSNQADVAVYSLNKDFVQSTYKQVGLSISNDLPFATSSEIDNLLSSDPDLYSSGRTTGAKGEGGVKLKVNQINATIQVGTYGTIVPAVIKFTNVIGFIAVPSAETRPFSEQCDYPIKGGDSGSALIANINGTKKIIGLVFAGSVDRYGVCKQGFACNIQSVAYAANISSLSSSNPQPAPILATASKITSTLKGSTARTSFLR